MKTTRFIPGLPHCERYATDSAELTICIKIRPERTVPWALTSILSWKYGKTENSSLPGKSKAFWYSEQGFHQTTKFRSTSSGGTLAFACACTPPSSRQELLISSLEAAARMLPLRLYPEKRPQVINGQKLTHFTTPLRAHGWLRLPGYLHYPTSTAIAASTRDLKLE